MTTAWEHILFFSILAALAFLVGTALVWTKEAWCRRNTPALLAFSAGVMLAVSFTHILPEATALTTSANYIFLLTFVAFYALEQMLVLHPDREGLLHSDIDKPNSHDAHCANPHPLGGIALVGMSLHSLLDGLIIGVGFEIDLEIGILSTLAIIIHKLPAGVSIASILLHYGYRKAKALTFTAIVAFSTPLGAICAYLFLKHLPLTVLGMFMSVAAGSFIYIAASDLIPESHRERGAKGVIALLGGIIVALAAGVSP
ncbi:MAG: ZIP family metal transporter [Desulfuromonadales bacterium]|nr:ZIP family metal transporter [Desulfuromonadales bacterium]MDT8422896.1 ZIP family metal transporter [Desulfuromonadales bacterium]